MYQTHGELTATPPFDFASTLRFLNGFSPAYGEQRLDEHTLTKAISLDGQVIVFRLWSTGTVEQPQLAYTLFSETELTDDVRKAAVDRIAFFLSLSDDLMPFYAIGLADPQFAPILQQFYGYHQVKFLTPFENACWAVLSQRNLFTVSRRMKEALIERFGGRVMVEGTTYRAFPEPVQLAVVDTDTINMVVGNRWKSEGLSHVARAFDGMDEEWLRTAPYREVERWLRQIKGIGEWSARFILLRGLGRMDGIPSGDKWLTEAVSQFYGQTMNGAEIQKLADHYGPYQGYWAHYLRIAAD